MLIYANNASALAAPGTGMCSTPSMTAAIGPVMATGIATSAVAVGEQAFWQRKPFPTAGLTHHNSMDLGTDFGAAGSAVRTDAGRPPRGVPR